MKTREHAPKPKVEAPGLREEIEQVINRHNAESGSDTPDHILAAFLTSCLGALDRAVKERERWYGRYVRYEAPQVIAEHPHA